MLPGYPGTLVIPLVAASHRRRRRDADGGGDWRAADFGDPDFRDPDQRQDADEAEGRRTTGVDITALLAKGRVAGNGVVAGLAHFGPDGIEYFLFPNFMPWAGFLTSFAYLGLLFAIAYYADKRADAGRSVIASPATVQWRIISTESFKPCPARAEKSPSRC